jgi:ABC-2 type transport system permease protein
VRKIFAIAWKDTRIRFSGWSEWLFFLVLPIIFTLIVAGGTGGSTDPRISLVVVDEANSNLSAQLIAALQKSEAVRPELQPLATAQSQLSQRQVSAVLVIPPEFDLQHIEGGSVQLELRQLPNDINAAVAQRAVQAVLSRVSSIADIASTSVTEAEKIKPFESLRARQEYFDASLQEAQAAMDQAPARVAVSTAAANNRINYDPRANSSAGQLITWVFIPLIAISSMFAYERQKGTLRRVLTTPTRKSTYLLGTIIGQVLIALVQMLLLIGFGSLFLNLAWGRSPAALSLMLVASALAAAALGTALGTLVKTEGQASGLSILFGMILALLGGCWYPIELFPQVVRTAVQILPTTWAMRGLLDILLRGAGLVAILPTAAVLFGFAAVFFLIGIFRFRYE